MTFVQLRKYQRYGLEVPVIFSWKNGRRALQQDIGLTRDLSVAGAFIFTTALPPSGATLRFKAFLPPSSATTPVLLHGRGQVVRVEPSHNHTPAGFAVAAKQRMVLRRREAVR
jgi:hypothetical protein